MDIKKRQDNRLKALFDLGFIFDGQYLATDGISFHHSDTLVMEDKEFDTLLSQAKTIINKNRLSDIQCVLSVDDSQQRLDRFALAKYNEKLTREERQHTLYIGFDILNDCTILVRYKDTQESTMVHSSFEVKLTN